MPRVARLIEPNGFYHIISRSLNEVWMFQDNNDFARFIQLIFTAKQKFPIRLYHYAILNNHFHFIAQTPSHKCLSKNLAYLKWHYTLWMRKKYAWKGPLWRERYKSLPIENESYLYACGTYIEFNPVRAGICKNPEDYIFSSYRKYHLGIVDTLVDNYEPPVRHVEANKIDYRSELSKNFFSASSAIGSPLFVEKFRNVCPKK